MSDTRPSVRPRVVRALVIALSVIAVIVLVPVLIVLYLVFKTDEWQGDVPAVVESVSSAYGTVSVEFPADLPPEALDRTLVGSSTVREAPTGVRVGETLTCRVRQTYQFNTDSASGPDTDVLTCER